jgi:hypothetical protein
VAYLHRTCENFQLRNGVKGVFAASKEG